MSRFLANENVPRQAIEHARRAGLDLEWIEEIEPGMDDDAVLSRSISEQRVLLTFDKDFGELAFRSGKQSSCGVILIRLKVRDPDFVAQFLVEVLSQNVAWEGHFSVAREGRLKLVPLPK